MLLGIAVRWDNVRGCVLTVGHTTSTVVLAVLLVDRGGYECEVKVICLARLV